MRLFVALNFNELKEYFSGLQKQIPAKDAKLTFPKDFHLTLKFLGEVNENKVDEVKQNLSEIKFKAFESEVNNVGFFSEQFLRVVWINADSKELINLQKQVDDKLKGIRKDEFEFKPHITLARIKFVKDKKAMIDKIKQIKTEPKKIKISNFELIQSTLTPEGPVYEVLEKFQSD